MSVQLQLKTLQLNGGGGGAGGAGGKGGGDGAGAGGGCPERVKNSDSSPNRAVVFDLPYQDVPSRKYQVFGFIGPLTQFRD